MGYEKIKKELDSERDKVGEFVAGKKSWSASDVMDLFNSGNGWAVRGWNQEYDELATFLNKGWFVVRQIFYTPTCEPPQSAFPSAERVVFARSFQCGGEQHSLLKWWAWNWLKTQGEDEPEFEQPCYHGGRCDVWSPKFGLVVECGNTSPGYVIESLAHDKCGGFVLFPFVYHGERHTAYVFERSPTSGEGFALRRAAQEELFERVCTRMQGGPA